MDHRLGQKTVLINLRKFKLYQTSFGYNIVRIEINNKKKNCKKTKHMESKQLLLKNQWVTEEIEEEIKIYLETNENGNT